MKNKEVFILVILTVFITCNLYPSQKDEKLTGLYKELSNSKDKNKASLYNKISKELVDSLPQIALVYADSSRLFASRFSDKKNILLSNYIRGEAYYQMNEYDQSIENFLLALKDEQNAEDDTFRGDIYSSLAFSYYRAGNHELAIKYFTDCLVYYEQAGNDSIILRTYYYLASCYHDNGDYTSSLQAYFMGVNLFEGIEEPEMRADIYNGLGVLYFDMGSYEKALDYYTNAYKLYEDAGNLSGVSNTMNNIGIVYYDWGNIEKALEYYQRSLQIEESLDSEMGMAGLYNNIGIIYHDWGQYDICIDYYEKSLALYQKFNNLIGGSYALNNLGETYADLGKYDKALDCLFRSLQIELDIGTPRGAAMSFESISKAYMKMGDLKNALKYIEMCTDIADSIDQAQIKMMCKQQHYELYKKKKSYKKALQYYEESVALKDSIYNQRFQDKITDLQVAFEFDQKQQEVEKQKLNNNILKKERHVQRSYLIIIFTLLVVFGFLIFYDIRSKSITNKKLNKSNSLLTAEKEKLSEAIAQIRENEEKYRSLIKLYHSGILFVDKDGNIIEVNDKMLSILGLRNDKPFDEINCFQYPPMVEMGLAADLIKCKNSVEPIYNETHFITKWGKSLFVKYFLTPVTDQQNNVTSIVANVEDVTATLEAAKQRHESEQKHRMLVENSLQAMLIIQDARIIFANKRMEELSKYTYEELSDKGRRWLEALIHPEDIKRSIENVRKALSGKQVSPTQVYKIIRKDGKVRIMETKSTVVDYKGKPAMLVVAIDDTCRKSAEIRLKESEKKLLQANATKDRFFSIIAHDLKNPFGSIVGFANLLNEAYDNFADNQRKEFIKNICEASENTFKLLQNLLEWSRTQTDNMEFDPEDIDINKLINESITLLKTGFKNKDLNLEVSIPENTKAFADENMVKVIIRNLLTNAIKFSNEGGRVSIEANTRGEQLELAIKDEGIGISEKNLEQIFRIDEHMKTKGTKNEEGTGLGLILCKEFVEMNNGHIYVESVEGEGSKFSFTLPFAQS